MYHSFSQSPTCKTESARLNFCKTVNAFQKCSCLFKT
jgi:hypothetical protein